MSLVMLVEDDEDLREVTALMIKGLGHEVLQSATAESAMPLIERHQVDVLVTDVGLPGTSGEVFAAEACSVRPAMRIVFLTGSQVLADRTADGLAPVLLRKPVDIDALEIVLGRTIG